MRFSFEIVVYIKNHGGCDWLEEQAHNGETVNSLSRKFYCARETFKKALNELGVNYQYIRKQTSRGKPKRCLHFYNDNNTGFYNLSKYEKDGTFRYHYYTDDGVRGQLRSNDLLELEDTVISEGYDWFIIDEAKANKTLKDEGLI